MYFDSNWARNNSSTELQCCWSIHQHMADNGFLINTKPKSLCNQCFIIFIDFLTSIFRTEIIGSGSEKQTRIRIQLSFQIQIIYTVQICLKRQIIFFTVQQICNKIQYIYFCIVKYLHITCMIVLIQVPPSAASSDFSSTT